MPDIKLQPDKVGDGKVRNRTEEYQRRLRGGAFRSETLIYPDNLGDVTNGLGSYVLFNVNVTSGSRFTTKYGSTGEKNVERPDGTVLTRQGDKRNRSNVGVLQGGTTRTDASILLYMPPTFNMSETVDWQNAELGAAGRIANRLSSASNALSGVSGLSDVIDLAGPLGNAVSQGAKDLAATAAGGLGAVGAGDVAGAIEAFRREIKNPNVEVLFKGVQNRSFQFQFKFSPKNEGEVETIAKIIQAFRFHKAPEIKGDAVIGRHLKYPSEFDIGFYFVQEQGDQNGLRSAVENPFLPKLATCVLTSVESNYNGSGTWTVHENGMPVEIDMTLSFTELEIITKDRVLQGY